ncbi:MAG: tRNA lysidine(34) synthetase TilS, partial [Rhodospirillales bacterium]
MMLPTAISHDEFDAAMRQFGAFELKPHLAVAVSGGLDSMALAVLADGWCRPHQGHVSALVVDHG